MAISHEDYLDIKRSMGQKSAKEAVKASYDYVTRKGKPAKSKALAKKGGERKSPFEKSTGRCNVCAGNHPTSSHAGLAKSKGWSR